MKNFKIPLNYKSSILDRIKLIRSSADPRKKDFRPSPLHFSDLTLYLPRHFGFCFGVQNAVEKSFEILNQNPNKRVFLISEMIHNPSVNKDLQELGLHFIQDTEGNQLIPWNQITNEDIVIIPAFGTSLDILEILHSKNIPHEKYDTTCPFVERVWKKGAELSHKDYTIIIHGSPEHEETRATFSRISSKGRAIIVKDLDEAKKLAHYIGSQNFDNWSTDFGLRCSDDFNPSLHLVDVAVINQTTMLADDTKAISDLIQSTINLKNKTSEALLSFANTRDTLCYATNDNQISNKELLNSQLDAAIIVGGSNSSNTTHLAELHQQYHPTYFIDGADKIDTAVIRHYSLDTKMVETSKIDWKSLKNIAIVAGASCPDSIIEELMRKILSFQPQNADIEDALNQLEKEFNGF